MQDGSTTNGAFAPAGSPEAIALARSMGIDENAVHLFSSLGLAAVARQREEWTERTTRPGAHGRYVETVADAFLSARGLAVTRAAA
jgi:hypothetical protein